jgi:hypothetical protein
MSKRDRYQNPNQPQTKQMQEDDDPEAGDPIEEAVQNSVSAASAKPDADGCESSCRGRA